MVFVYYGEFSRFSDCENWIASALDRNGHSCVRLQRGVAAFDPQGVVRVIKAYRASVLLLSKTPEITREHLNEIRRQTNVKIVFWTFDWMMHGSNREWYIPLAQEADICFQTDGFGESIYEELGIRRVELHQAVVPRLHDIPEYSTPEEVHAYASDIAFCGSVYTKRRQDLCRQLDAYPGFQKWGNPQRELWGREFATACALSKIVVGDNFVNDVHGYWSDRVYLTLGCGGFFMTAYVPGLELEFENHKHLVWWHDFDELHDMIQYYLSREAERRSIARAGYCLVHSRDLYDHRIQRMTLVLESE